MNQDDQIYVKFGDYIILHVEHIQGNVASQGFSNRNCYVQMNPEVHQECFTRNKRDFQFQIWPKLNFDARQDYLTAVKFYEKNFEEKNIAVEDDKQGDKKDGDEEEEEVIQDGETSFFNSKGSKAMSSMSSAMKKDRDNFIKKLQQLERKLKEEEDQNGNNFNNKKGNFVEYGNEIQLLHVDSNCFMQAAKQCADEDNSCNKVELTSHGSKFVHFKALGGFKYKQEGDRIHYNDQIVLQNLKLSSYLHGLKDLYLNQSDLGWNLSRQRRQTEEIHLLNTYRNIQIYRYYNEDLNDQFIKGSSIIRLLHSERGGYLHSDDKDFTNDGLAEVYLWNFKGKTSDLEALSSSSLFELELASVTKSNVVVTPISEKGQAAEPSNKEKSAQDRTGKVFSYSETGGIQAKQAFAPSGGGKQVEEAQYRLRHLNTGRLVVDQEISYHGIKMRTLGLAPHLVAKNLAQVSDKPIDTIQQDLKDLDNQANYVVENYSEGSPKDYNDLDKRSRFRIISTSPSLDTRIRSNSCVQIQHVNSEMYLSYETQTSFMFLGDATQNKGPNTIQTNAEMMKEIHQSMKDEDFQNLKSPAHTNRNIIKQDKLYCPVDDDDIQSGSRDAIELKPQKSNEDAFFIIPENPHVLQNILFIQTAVDLLKKYLPTICSRNLDISKEKQTKIFDLLDRIEEFLVGDTRDAVGHEGSNNLESGFSKDENDMQHQRNQNLKLRQKLMRELYIVESLVHIIYLPFSFGDFKLESITGNDLIARVCQKVYNLIKIIGIGYYQNELYVSQWINLYFNHAMSTDSSNNIGAEDTIISLVDNNKKLLQMQITPAIIQKIVNLSKVQTRQRQLIQLLKAISSCHGEPIENNQNDIVQILLEDDQSRTMLMMPVRMKNEGEIDVLMDSNDIGTWEPLTDYKKFGRKIYGYFLSLIDLSAELCLGRNNRAFENLLDMFAFDTVKSLVKNPDLPCEMRALFMRILLNMHMDREPLEKIQIPSQTGVWNDLPPFIKEQFSDPLNISYPIKQSKISVPSSLTTIKRFVENYLHETKGVQNIFETGKNMMTFEVLKIIQFMLHHGFYNTLQELKEVSTPMVNLLNGSNDVYYNKDDEQLDDSNIDEFLTGKRYFCSGNNDIIVQCKSIICENLLIISQLEIDGKAQIFLSKFKADLDMIFLQKQISSATPAAVKDEQDEKEKGKQMAIQKIGGGLFNFKKFKVSLGAEEAPKSNKLSFKQIEHDNIQFLEEIACSFNFEANSQDAYICVLFDLLLYKYPLLAKGVFELLVKLFARKRSLLENLMQIQMLENPRSIQILIKLKRYHSDLKAYIQDADQWLNKTNQQSKKIKYRVTQIFAYYSQICHGNYYTTLDEAEFADFKRQSTQKTPDIEMNPKLIEEPEGENTMVKNRSVGVGTRKDVHGPNSKNSKVNKMDFLLFDKIVNEPSNKENQRLLSSFEVENLAMFFIKYRVDRNSVNDPFYQQLIHQCYNFLVMYVKDNFQNQMKVHANLEIFLKDIDKNPLICLLIYGMFKDNQRFLTLNVSKILRQIILSAEEASLQSSKKALYLKLLEVFCKFEDKLVRPNQQEIVINFTRDISKNNLIYLFSNEGRPHLCKIIQNCLPDRMKLVPPEGYEEVKHEDEKASSMSIEVFNVIQCLNLMSICCEGKSDLAEIKCQTEIINMSTALILYRNSGKLWPFKCSLLKYIAHCYLDSGNYTLFLQSHFPMNVTSLKQIIDLVKDDMVEINVQWHNKNLDCLLIMPDGSTSSFIRESRIFALEYVCHFFKSFLKNRHIELGVDMFPVFHEITSRIAKMYYETNNENFKTNSMDILYFINNSEKYARLLENVQHPANQNIYLESLKKGKERARNAVEDESGQKSSQLSSKLNQLAFSQNMIEQKEREFEVLVFWVTNINQRINTIMENNAKINKDAFNIKSFECVSYNHIVTSFMTLLDSKCLSKDLHITGLTLLRKIVEVENKELVSPAADWGSEDWENYQKIIESKQNTLVDIGCIEFLCKHIQDIDDDEILEQTFLVCITLLLGGNEKSQNAFFNYFQHQDTFNVIMIKLKRMLMEQFDLTKKFIGEKNAKLAMIYKVNQRKEIKESREQQELELAKEKANDNSLDGQQITDLIQIGGAADPGEQSEEGDENLLTIDENNDENEETKGSEDEMFLVNQTKNQSIQRCMRLLRFVQLLTEGHHTQLQNYLREQVMLNGLPNQKSFDFISYVAQMMAIYEKQFINCYSCALGMQLIDTLIEVVQGPCKLNQGRLVEAKIIDCCRDLIQQGQQSTTELKIRGFTTDSKLELHDQLKMSSVKLLLSIIEGAVDKVIYRQIADSLDDFVILNNRMDMIYDRFISEDLGLNPDTATLSQIKTALRKDSFKGNIIEGFDIFCLINQLAIALPDVNHKIEKFKNGNIYQFFSQNTGNVEIAKDKDIMTIYFPIHPVTYFLTAETISEFTIHVNRESNQHKIINLLSHTAEFIDEMEHLENKSHMYIKVTPDRLSFFRDFSTILAVAISFIVIGFYKYEMVEIEDGSFDFTSYIDYWPGQMIKYLGYGQLVTTLILLFGFCLNKINIIVRSGWRQYTMVNKSKLANDIKYILKPLEPPFGELKAKDLPLQAARILLLTEGPYHSAFEDENGKNYGYLAVNFEYKWISLSFLIQNGGFIFIMIYLAFSLQGLFQSPIFYSFHLLDVINRFPQLQNVIKSVTLNGGQLLMTGMLGIIIIYIYSAICYIFLYDTYYDDAVHSGLLNRKGDSVCQSMMHCFLSSLNLGLRGGGGVGEFTPTQTAVPENKQGFYFKSIFDLTFFLIVITILLNIIFGIIIDTFAQLRNEKYLQEDDIRNVCFICGLDRQTFDRETSEGFDVHITNDHYIWAYLNFIIHLLNIEATDLNGTESYILDLFEKEDISWFPMNKSQKLIMNAQKNSKEAKEAAAMIVGGDEEIESLDPMTNIESGVTDMEDKVIEVYNKFCSK